MDKESEVIAEAENQVENVEETQNSTNVSDQDFINLRSKAPEEPEKQPEETQEEVTEDSNNVLSKINLDELSEQEIKELGQKLGAGAVKRFGKMTAMRKQAEEENQALKKKLKELQGNKSQKVSQKDLVDNPYKDIKTPEGLQKKLSEVEQVIEWADDILDASDDYRANDIVTEQNGKQLTKADVRKIQKSARKSKDKYLPQQGQFLRQASEAQVLQKNLVERTRKEISWSKDPESEVTKKYQAMLNDRRLVDSLENADPSLKAQMPYILAHAANSMYARKVVDTGTTQPTKQTKSLSPPKSVNTTAAVPSRNRDQRKKVISAKKQIFKSSNGNVDSFIKLRTEQLSR